MYICILFKIIDLTVLSRELKTICLTFFIKIIQQINLLYCV